MVFLKIRTSVPLDRMTAQRTRTATTLWAHLPALVKLDFQEMAKSAKVRNRYFVFFLFYYYYFFNIVNF